MEKEVANKKQQDYRDLYEVAKSGSSGDQEAFRSLMQDERQTPEYSDMLFTLREDRRFERERERTTQYEQYLESLPPEISIAERLRGEYLKANQISDGNLRETTMGQVVTSAAREIFQKKFFAMADIRTNLVSNADTKDDQQLVSALDKALQNEVTNKWRLIKPAQLAELASWYTHDLINYNFAAGMMRAYFEGPKAEDEEARRSSKKMTKEDDKELRHLYKSSCVQAIEIFALGILDKAHDKEVLKSATFIAKGEIDEILPANSDCLVQFASCRNTGIDFLDRTQLIRVERERSASKDIFKNLKNPLESIIITNQENLELFARTYNIDQVFGGLSKFFGIDNQLKKQQITDDLSVQMGIDDLREEGWTDFQINLGLDLVSDTVRPQSLAPIRLRELKKNPIFLALINSKNLARTKLFETIGSEIHAVRWKNNILLNLNKEEPLADISEIAIPLLQESDYLTILMPNSLKQKKQDVAAGVFQDIQRKEGDSATSEHLTEEEWETLNFAGTPVTDGTIELDGQKIYYLKRTLSSREGQRHPLSFLQERGFPAMSLSPEESLNTINENLVDQIRRTRSRFLNTRGYLISFEGTSLAEYGYDSLEVYKDPKDRKSIRAAIRTSESVYEVKMHPNLQFDFEGKAPPATEVLDSISYVIFSYLKPLLCTPEEPKGSLGRVTRQERNEQRDSEEMKAKRVFEHTGYLTPLREDWRSHNPRKFTSQANDNCIENEGISLHSINYERSLMKLEPVTYAKPKFAEDDDSVGIRKPPVPIKLSPPELLEKV